MLRRLRWLSLVLLVVLLLVLVLVSVLSSNCTAGHTLVRILLRLATCQTLLARGRTSCALLLPVGL